MVSKWDPARCGVCGVDMLVDPHAGTCWWACPLNGFHSHHWVNARSGVNSIGEPTYSLRCACGADYDNRVWPR